MFSAKFFKSFLIFSLAFCSSCQYWQSNSNTNANIEAPPTEIAEIVSEIPFPTKEPDTFQAEMIVRINEEESKTFIARDKERFLSKKGDIATLQLSPNQSFLINFSRKIYVENKINSSPANVSGETLSDFLTTEWLNQKTDVKYENLGSENGFSKYRVKFEHSESLIFVDENFKFPTKQEFHSIDGETKNLVYSMELKNIKLIAEDSLFEVPKDFRKVSLEEFQKSRELGFESREK